MGGMDGPSKTQSGSLFDPGEGQIQLENTAQVDPVRLPSPENRLHCPGPPIFEVLYSSRKALGILGMW